MRLAFAVVSSAGRASFFKGVGENVSGSSAAFRTPGVNRIGVFDRRGRLALAQANPMARRFFEQCPDLGEFGTAGGLAW